MAARVYLLSLIFFQQETIESTGLSCELECVFIEWEWLLCISFGVLNLHNVWLCHFNWRGLVNWTNSNMRKRMESFFNHPRDVFLLRNTPFQCHLVLIADYLSLWVWNCVQLRTTCKLKMTNSSSCELLKNPSLNYGVQFTTATLVL